MSSTVTKDPATRARIDAALLSGLTPMETWQQYGRDLGLSLSAVYRHARSKPRTALAVVWLGDSLSGDVIADLAAQRVSHLQERDRALARGDYAGAAREGTAALSAAQSLLRAGVDGDAAAGQLRDHDQLVMTVKRAIIRNAEFARQLANAARELSYGDLATDFDDSAELVENYRLNRKKEK